MTVLYISGPMSGMLGHNFPAFHAAAKKYRDRGFEVINPAELDDTTQPGWEHYLRRGLAELLKADMVFMLPGWQQSRGARLENHVAAELGMWIISGGEG